MGAAEISQMRIAELQRELEQAEAAVACWETATGYQEPGELVKAIDALRAREKKAGAEADEFCVLLGHQTKRCMELKDALEERAKVVAHAARCQLAQELADKWDAADLVAVEQILEILEVSPTTLVADRVESIKREGAVEELNGLIAQLRCSPAGGNDHDYADWLALRVADLQGRFIAGAPETGAVTSHETEEAQA